MKPHKTNLCSPVAVPPHWPHLIPMGRAPGLTGLSRAGLYRAAAAGEITIRKLGRSSLVDAASLAAFIARLPEAKIGGGAK
jgi:hypothetical protein